MASCTTADDNDYDADYDDEAAVAEAGVMRRTGCCCCCCSYGVVMHASRVLMNTLPSISPAERRRRLAANGCDASRLARRESILSLKCQSSIREIQRRCCCISPFSEFSLSLSALLVSSRLDVLCIICNGRMQMKTRLHNQSVVTLLGSSTKESKQQCK